MLILNTKQMRKKNKAACSNIRIFGLSDQTLACGIHGLQYFILWRLSWITLKIQDWDRIGTCSKTPQNSAVVSGLFVTLFLSELSGQSCLVLIIVTGQDLGFFLSATLSTEKPLMDETSGRVIKRSHWWSLSSLDNSLPRKMLKFCFSFNCFSEI